MRVTRNFLGQGVSFEKERPRRKKTSLKKFSKEILTTDGPNRDIFFSIRALSNFQKGAGEHPPLPLDTRLKHLICNTRKKGPAGKNTEDFLNTHKTAF